LTTNVSIYASSADCSDPGEVITRSDHPCTTVPAPTSDAELCNDELISSCPLINDIYFTNEAPLPGYCATGHAYFTGIHGRLIDHVDWFWYLSTHSGTEYSTGDASPIYYTPGYWDGYIITVCVEVTLNNGTECDRECKNFDLSCGSSGGGGEQTLHGGGTSFYPNPAKNSVVVKTNPKMELSRINIIDNRGALVKTINNEFQDEIDLQVNLLN